MTQQDKDLLEQNGFDVQGALHRFINNDTLYQQCLNKFLDDASYGQLQEAMKQGDCQAAFREAHTMKGFVSNLGMIELYEAVSAVVEILRTGNMEVSQQMQILDEIYAKDRKILEEIIHQCSAAFCGVCKTDAANLRYTFQRLVGVSKCVLQRKTVCKIGSYRV